MSITLSSFLDKVSILLNDYLTGTTTADGNTAKTTFIDSSLSKYPDNYFGSPERNPEWWAYVGTTLRSIKDFVGNTGTVIVHNAFSSQVTTSTAYSIHKYDRDKKILACNLSLYECYPDFYLRVDDETTLDGLGSSDIDYEVPSAFTEFPDQIWKKHTSGDKITYTQITNYEAKLVDGKWKFYANITKDDDILLVGKTYLSQFTNDASETELTEGQANTVAYLAASIFCRMMAGTVNATDSGRFDAMAQRFRGLYEENANKNRMSRLTSLRSGFDWANGYRGYAWRNG